MPGTRPRAAGRNPFGRRQSPPLGGTAHFFKKSEQTLPRQQAAEILERGLFSPMIRAHRSDHRRRGRTLTAQFRKSPRIFRSDFLRIFSGNDFQWLFSAARFVVVNCDSAAFLRPQTERLFGVFKNLRKEQKPPDRSKFQKVDFINRN